MRAGKRLHVNDNFCNAGFALKFMTRNPAGVPLLRCHTEGRCTPPSTSLSRHCTRDCSHLARQPRRTPRPPSSPPPLAGHTAAAPSLAPGDRPRAPQPALGTVPSGGPFRRTGARCEPARLPTCTPHLPTPIPRPNSCLAAAGSLLQGAQGSAGPLAPSLCSAYCGPRQPPAARPNRPWQASPRV